MNERPSTNFHQGTRALQGATVLRDEESMMTPEELLISNFLIDITQGREMKEQVILADDVILHIPGRSRFAGDYFGKLAVRTFWSLHQRALNPSVPSKMSYDDEQITAVISLHAYRADAVLVCRGTHVLHVVRLLITEWWLTIDDQAAFDAFWSYHATATIDAN